MHNWNKVCLCLCSEAVSSHLAACWAGKQEQCRAAQGLMHQPSSWMQPEIVMRAFRGEMRLHNRYGDCLWWHCPKPLSATVWFMHTRLVLCQGSLRWQRSPGQFWTVPDIGASEKQLVCLYASQVTLLWCHLLATGGTDMLWGFNFLPGSSFHLAGVGIKAVSWV